jgi:N-acetylglucosaminyldiphosphoundecaprenol N-acetyl-beta-D-mannosaminyltransferase
MALSLSRVPTVDLFGVRIANISEVEAARIVVDSASDGRGGWIATVNTDILRQVQRTRELSDLVATASLIVADGMPLVWASRLQRSPLKERVAGSNLVWSISRLAAAQALPIFLLGGDPGVASSAADVLQSSIENLTVAGTYSPPFGFEYDTRIYDEICAALRAARPAIVYCGLGFPKQEKLITALQAEFRSTWFLASGFSFSFVAGAARRAPAPIQAAGLEWAHRLVQEPRRLFRRYVLHDIPFGLRLIMSAGRRGAKARATNRDVTPAGSETAFARKRTPPPAGKQTQR